MKNHLQTPPDEELQQLIQNLEEDEGISEQEKERRKLREEQQLGSITDGYTVEAVQHWLDKRQELRDRQVLERLWRILDLADEDRIALVKEKLDKELTKLLRQHIEDGKNPDADKNELAKKAWNTVQLKRKAAELMKAMDGMPLELKKADQILKSIVYANRDRRNEEHYKKVQAALDALAKEMLPHARVIESESIQDIIDSLIPESEDEKIMKQIQTKLRDAENVRKSKKLVQESGAYDLASQMVLEMLTRSSDQKNAEFYSALEKKVKTELDQMALGAAQEDLKGAEKAVRQTAKYDAKVGRELAGEAPSDEEASVDWMNEL
ncbi:MAG: hypothetical protein AB7J40_04320 [Candidatus Altimarinota bacterium]